MRKTIFHLIGLLYRRARHHLIVPSLEVGVLVNVDV